MINLRHPKVLWDLSKRLGLGLQSTGNLFGAYYFGRRPIFKKFCRDIVVLEVPDWGKLPIRVNGYDHKLLIQIFEREIYRIHAENVRRIVDLGANIGLASVYLSRLFPDAEIACVEPSPENTPLLRQAMLLNRIRSQIFEAAIGSRGGTTDLYLSDKPDCNSTVTPQGSANVACVAQISMPELMKRMEWDQIDLLKIDIEGAEKFVLGENNSWLHSVRMIVGESHVNVGYPFAQMERDLKRFGFVLEILEEETEAYGATFRGVNTRPTTASAV